MNDTLAAALDYCARGWRVLPLWPVVGGGDGSVCLCVAGPSCRDPGKHPACSGGASSATTEAARVREFWRRFSARWVAPGVGVATGAGLVVIDVDARHTGDETWSRLLEGRAKVDTVTSLTGGGLHVWWSAARRIPSSVGRLGPGVDVRGEGGYVVAPPTLHASGRRYRWEASSDPTDGARLAALPEWLAEAACSSARGEVERTAALRAGLAPGSVGAGERNDTMARVACSMRSRGLGPEELAEALAAVNATACVEPLPARELSAIVRGVCRRYGAGWSAGVRGAVAAGEDAYQRAAAAEGDYPWKADPAAILAGLHAPVPADPGGPDV